jgi:hypothetical protein
MREYRPIKRPGEDRLSVLINKTEKLKNCLTQALSLMPFPLTFVVGDIAVDTPQGLMLFSAFGFVFMFVISLLRN